MARAPENLPIDFGTAPVPEPDSLAAWLAHRRGVPGEAARLRRRGKIVVEYYIDVDEPTPGGARPTTEEFLVRYTLEGAAEEATLAALGGFMYRSTVARATIPAPEPMDEDIE